MNSSHCLFRSLTAGSSHAARAGDFIANLPKREHAKPERQLVAKDLMRAAAGHAPWRFIARIAIMHALYGKREPPIGNPNDAQPAPKWRNKPTRDPWRGEFH